jgi:hypothetical protein
MKIHERTDDAKGMGKRDVHTGRYIPVGGGSRTRLPVTDDPRISRYEGNVGLDSCLSEEIHTMAALYAELGGLPVAQPGKDVKFARLLIDETLKRLKMQTAEPEPTEPGDAAASKHGEL